MPDVADGIVRLAVAQMTAALRRVSVQRGIDPRDYTLVAFGGAGPLHAGLLLRDMGFRAVLVPRFPGLFAASGLTATDIRVDDSRTVLRVLGPGLLGDLAAWYAAAGRELARQLRRDGVPPGAIRLAATADCRFLGQGYELSVPLRSTTRRGLTGLAADFRRQHLRTYGHASQEQEVEVVNVRLSAFGGLPSRSGHPEPAPDPAGGRPPGWAGSRRRPARAPWRPGCPAPRPPASCPSTSGIRSAPARRWPARPSCTSWTAPPWCCPASGPAPTSWAACGWRRPGERRPAARRAGVSPTPSPSSCSAPRCTSAAVEMGEVLKHSSYSPIIREMDDFSCALFAADGDLVAQADFIPAQLGAMSLVVKSIISRWGSAVAPGDAYLANHPYLGAMHTPDLNVIMPMFRDGELLAWTGTAAHHIDVGGVRPGTEGPDLSEVYAEGLLLPPVRLYRAGQENPDVFAFVGAAVRDPVSTLSDLRAQRAACLVGERRVTELADRYGAAMVTAVFGLMLDSVERATRLDLADLPDGEAEAEGYLDDDGVGGPPVRIAARLAKRGDTLTVDLSGCAAQVPGAMNVPWASTRASVVYAIRAMTDPARATNDGILRAVRDHLPARQRAEPRAAGRRSRSGTTPASGWPTR